ncbi:MAG TPA: TetR/AcrR family transcriptional regulator [Solirubrobacteraceae bacterium]|jgi:AcrR family transcriptional regulator|nr:TetR/AcrR family transcriptional regulator [Solirubrobacteraceae bacterium]
MTAGRQWRAGAGRRARRPDQVAEFQRVRILSAATLVAFEHGYEGMTATAVVTRARVSRKTFYDLFESREDCFMAVLEEALDRLAALVAPAYASELAWAERVRAALVAVLAFCETEPEAGTLVVSYLVGCGPDDDELRALVLELVTRALAAGRAHLRPGRRLSPLTEQGVAGAVLAVLHARVRRDPKRLCELANPLMSIVVLPYLGQAAAARQLRRPAQAPARVTARPARPRDPLARLNMRLTYRTARVLTAIAAQPGTCNHEIAESVGVADQGQISKLLKRLAGLELIQNTGAGQARGTANAWHLMPLGAELESAITRDESALAS